MWSNPKKTFANLTERALRCQLVVGLANVDYDANRLFDLVRAACEAGVSLVQYREKGERSVDFEKRLAVAVTLSRICQKKDVLFFIDDDVDLAIASGADGVHVGQDDTSVASIVERAPQLLIGLSISTMAEFEKSRSSLADLAYIGVGPVFDTKTKKDAKPSIGLAGLKRIKEAAQLPVIAIGGLTEENAAGVYEAGADGIAVISAITKSDNLNRTVQKLSNL
nr:thiamine phosphate synthase [Fructobacillus papyrifericola]